MDEKEIVQLEQERKRLTDVIKMAYRARVIEPLIRLPGDFQITLFSLLFPSPPILALFLVGPVAMWVELCRKRKQAPAS